jgi:transglutaminase-like putative cysteine protease
MTRLTILHETRYDYERAVGFGPHRLLIRPRDSHSLRVVDASLRVSPPGAIRWVYDALGNCVCLFEPRGEARSLVITSRLTIERFPASLTGVAMDQPRAVVPIVYDREDRTVIAPFMEPATDDDDPALLKWVRGLVTRTDEAALDFVLRMNAAIHQFAYRGRIEEGCQSPSQTLARGAGACRDLAWLMVEGLRRLGFAARFVTGYIYSAALDAGASGGALRGAGATHAWCEVFLPGLGWIEFDPTNGLAESPDLIPVAVTRIPAQAAPVSGSVRGHPGRSSLSVHVAVSIVNEFRAVA